MKSVNDMKISLIIVNHNGKKFIEKIIRTSLSQSYRAFEVIVVDTNSSDNSIELVKTKFPKVKVIEVKNKGFGFAANSGAKYAKGDFLMFFNEDMYLPNKFLETLISFRKNLEKKYQKKIGAVGCKIIPFNSKPDNERQNYGGKPDFLGFPTDVTNPKEVPFMINGCPFFIEKKLFLNSRGFNPNIFLYGEDEDICWRLNIFGYNHFVCNDTHLFHFGGGAINKNKERKVANVIASPLIPVIVNYGNFMLFIVIPIYIVSIFVINIGILLITKFNLNYNIEIVRVYLKIFRQLPSILKFRAWVQKKRKVGDLQILGKFSFVPSVLRNLSYKRLIKLDLK